MSQYSNNLDQKDKEVPSQASIIENQSTIIKRQEKEIEKLNQKIQQLSKKDMPDKLRQYMSIPSEKMTLFQQQFKNLRNRTTKFQNMYNNFIGNKRNQEFYFYFDIQNLLNIKKFDLIKDYHLHNFRHFYISVDGYIQQIKLTYKLEVPNSFDSKNELRAQDVQYMNTFDKLSEKLGQLEQTQSFTLKINENEEIPKMAFNLIFEALEKYKKLEYLELNMHKCNILNSNHFYDEQEFLGTLMDYLQQKIGNYTNLKVLKIFLISMDFEKNKATFDQFIESMHPLQKLEYLVLDLDHNQIGQNGMISISDLINHLPNLQNLEIKFGLLQADKNQITQFIEGLLKLKNLGKFNLNFKGNILEGEEKVKIKENFEKQLNQYQILQF